MAESGLVWNEEGVDVAENGGGYSRGGVSGEGYWKGKDGALAGFGCNCYKTV